MKIFIERKRGKGLEKRYQVLSFDPVTKRGRLKGDGVTFESNLAKEVLERHGYRLIKEP